MGSAERSRGRQIDTIEISRAYAQSSLKQLEEKLNQSLEQAAQMEKQGKPVPEAISQQIELYEKQINDQQAKITAIDGDIEKVNKEFEPIIERLKIISP